jgi:hypothetical protein
VSDAAHRLAFLALTEPDRRPVQRQPESAAALALSARELSWARISSLNQVRAG